MAEYVLTTQALTKIYKGRAAVNRVDMHIKRGDIYGFVGRNGAGKTTIIRLITGIIQANSGALTLFGESNRNGNINLARKKIGAVVETPSLYLNMTATDNLKMQCLLHGIKDLSVIDDVLTTIGLKDTGVKKASQFSLGMKQRLGIGMALVLQPEFLLLDEPANGLDPQGIVEVRELLLKLNHERGMTILISSHILDELSKLATCYGFIDNGCLLQEITTQQLQSFCKKSIRMSVSDTAALAPVLERFAPSEYRIYNEHQAEMFAMPQVTEFVLACKEVGVTVYAMTDAEQSLENYFFQLVGGLR